MKKLFAIPTENGQLCAHFGHCEKFAIIETEDNRVVNESWLTPPVHQPGVYMSLYPAEWVSERYSSSPKTTSKFIWG